MSASKTKTKKATGSALTVPVALPSHEEGGKTRLYWMGTLPNCPIQNVTAGGHTFPRFRGNPVFDGPRGTPSTPLVYGVEVRLTQEQVDLILKAVQIRAIRIDQGRDEVDGFEDVPEVMEDAPKPKKRRARIYMIDNTGRYKRKPGDKPLASMLYLHALDQMSAADQRVWPPQSMAGDEVEYSAIAPEETKEPEVVTASKEN